MDKAKVLFVDDDEDLLKMMRLRIEAEGYEFLCVRNGEEMLDFLKKKIPDVILLDVLLPKMDGYTALREMRKQEAFKSLPVIILTAKEERKIGDLFTVEGISHFVEKPFDARDLMRKIKGLLNG